MHRRDKPNAEAIGWRIRASETAYQNKTATFRVDTIELSEGKETQYGYVCKGPAVIIVPVTRDGQIVIVRQYRYPVDDWCLEVPAGGVHETEEESLEETVRRELREEAGATCGTLTNVGWFYSGPSLMDEKCHVFLGENVDVTRKAETEPSEKITIRLEPADEVVEMARSGKMKNGVCALAVLWCERLLRERGYI
ncbi:MAG TPA: NUDIX hydrolase [Chthoniobacterales bacterium]|nr:NUDIX hydrolase [Chthoniobacterales bacterium]